MKTDLSSIEGVHKILLAVSLRPCQGTRFQPTGFPDLGAATFQAPDGGTALLVESCQSMSNRMEATCWDEAEQDVAAAVKGISYIRVEEDGDYLTSSLTESHRINSPYILEGEDKSFFDKLVGELAAMKNRPINRKLLAETLLKYDIGSLLHGVFLAKSDIAGGRLRVERAVSAFIEAHGVQTAASGGVKKDEVNPQGDTAKGFGHVPFHRDEFTAQKITAFFNIDLAQIRGYGLGKEVENLLILLALYKVRALLDGDLRLRTACDLEVADDASLTATNVEFTLPALADIVADLPAAIEACKDRMAQETVAYKEKGKKKAAKKETE